MRILGVVLAGGRSSRFGSDKALALFAGRPLLAHAAAALAPHCASVGVAGRPMEELPSIADWPEPGLGPLGGLAGALRHAAVQEFDAVLSCGVDCVALPGDLLERLSPPPAFVHAQPVIGLWPTAGVAALAAFLATDSRRSMRGYADRIGARAVILPADPPNVNTLADLAQLERSPPASE